MDNCGRFVFYNNTFFFAKNQKQNNRHYVTYYIISMVYTLIDHSSRPISARGFALLLQKENRKGLFRHSTSPADSRFRIPEIFACGIRNPGNFCLWNPESRKNLHVESVLLDFGIRNTTQRIHNRTSDWNPESNFQ